MTTKTCPCGVTFTLTRHNQKFCPACREMRHNARQPQEKPCTKCGEPTRHRRQRKPYCDVCSVEASRKQREAIKAMRREAYERELDAKRTREAEQEDYLQHLAQQPQDVQRQHFFFALGWVINLLLGEGSAPPPPAAPEPEPVNPEQVPADDQAAIDATFAEIMASVNW